MNVEVVEICPGELEFYAKIRKKGDPVIPRNNFRAPAKETNADSMSIESLQLDLHHARKAFNEAVEVQEKLKHEINLLSRPFWKRLLNIK